MSYNTAAEYGEILALDSLQMGDYISFTDTATNNVDHAFFLGKLDPENGTFLCLGLEKSTNIVRGFIGSGNPIRMHIDNNPALLNISARLKELMSV